MLVWLNSKLTWLGLAIGALVLAFLRGVSIGAAKERVRYLEGYQKTRKDMDDAEAAQIDDPTAAHKWLRERMQNAGK